MMGLTKTFTKDGISYTLSETGGKCASCRKGPVEVYFSDADSLAIDTGNAPAEMIVFEHCCGCDKWSKVRFVGEGD